MIFRYKITPYCNFLQRYYYRVQIQEYSTKFPHWRKVVHNATIQEILYEINECAFKYKTDLSYGSKTDLTYVSFEDILEEIQKYDSIESIIIKYIIDVIMKQKKRECAEETVRDVLDKLIITKGWNTIEVKENKN